jgi:hypothetical protein
MTSDLIIKVVLTIPGHSNCDTFLESAVSTPVSIDPHYIALLVLNTWLILDLLMDTSTEKSLK